MTESIDLNLNPVSPGPLDTKVVVRLLDQMLAKAHPLLAEGLYLAAVAPRYDPALFAAMRARDDGRDDKLIARLARFSFIRETEETFGPGDSHYTMLPTERKILIDRWIETDTEAFLSAHRRALAFWQAHPHPDPFTQDQNLLYHQLTVDPEAGIERLADTFRAYTGERRLAAADRLLVTSAEARDHLACCATPHAALDALLDYLAARLTQFRGRWQESLAHLETMRQTDGLAPKLVPFVARAYGLALAKTGRYVEAIEQYRFALQAFQQQSGAKDEQAFTMIDLGDAHVDLAVSARGYRELVIPTGKRWRQWLSGLFSLRALLPLIAYLSFHFGPRVWRPGFWPMLQGQDWIIARLFVTGAQWYQQARQMLRAAGTPADRIQADEKLAHLYLTMGDAAQAASSLKTLLDDAGAPVGEYRRASIQAGVGQSLLRMGQPERALEHLQKALPVIRAYDDVELEAQTRGLMAEALIQCEKSTSALTQFRQAMRLYQKQDDRVGATEIAERLQELAQDQRLTLENRETASTTTQNLTRRQYQHCFQHPALVAFRRAGLVLLALFIFFVPLMAIHVETGSVLHADIQFFAAPLLEPDPNYSPSLSQAVALNVEPAFQADFVLRRAIELLLLYLVAYTVLGAILIARTRLRTVQAAQAQIVQIDLKALTVGRDKAERTLPWREIDQIVTADVELFDGPISDNSRLVVATPQTEATITGNTAWYVSLQDHILSAARNARTLDLSYRVLRSPMGWLYVFSLASLILFLLLRALAPATLTTDLLGTPYSSADLYPYLVLGLLIPPLWWIIVRPLRIQTHLQPRNTLPWWIVGAGFLLALLHWATASRSWFGLPDIYPLLTSAVLIFSAGISIWRTRRDRRDAHVYPFWARGLVAVAAIAILAWIGFRLWHEVGAYHYLMLGNAQRDDGVQAQAHGEAELADWFLQKAHTSYERALDLAPQNLTALKSRAAVRAQIGRYEGAIKDYTRALKRADASTMLYADRALAHVGWGLAQSDKAGATKEKLTAAAQDLDRAIAGDPTVVAYHVQRGVVRHALGEPDDALTDFEQALALESVNVQALAGRGWALFQQAEMLSDAAQETDDETQSDSLKADAQVHFKAALTSFQDAVAQDPRSSELWLALGYGHFKLEQYQETMNAWERAVELAPDDPDMIISRGTGHWLVADGARCASPTATDAEKAETVRHLTLAIDDLNRALTLHPDDHWTYRTRAQIEFLLRYCPDHDYQAQIERAIASYDSALTYAPENDLYWQFRARLGFVLGRHLFLQGPESETQAWIALSIAAADIEKAQALDPENKETQLWRDYIVNEGWGRYYWLRGWNYYEAENYAMAQQDSEKAALLLPQDAEAAFNAGLATLAQGEVKQAETWYREGLARTQAIEEAEARLKIFQTGTTDLIGLTEAQPPLRWLVEPILGSFHLQLGQEHIAAGDFPLAEAELEQANRLRPNDPTVAFEIGWLALRRADGIRATQWYTEGLSRAACIDEGTQKISSAIEALMTLLEAHPELQDLGVPILNRLREAADTPPSS